MPDARPSPTAGRIRCDALTELSVALHEIGNLWLLNGLVFGLCAILAILLLIVRGGHDAYLIPGVTKARSGIRLFWGEPAGGPSAPLVDAPAAQSAAATAADVPGSAP